MCSDIPVVLLVLTPIFLLLPILLLVLGTFLVKRASLL
jgi:hypothetical protein